MSATRADVSNTCRNTNTQSYTLILNPKEPTPVSQDLPLAPPPLTYPETGRVGAAEPPADAEIGVELIGGDSDWQIF